MNRDINFGSKKQILRLAFETLKVFLKILRMSDPDSRRRILQSFGVEKLVRLPVLTQDRADLRYLLYPDQNPSVYILGNGNYEASEEKFCLRYIRPGMVSFDVGGNIGLYALLLSKLVGEQGKVYTFEPESKNFLRLKENVGVNSLNNVSLNKLALGAQSGLLNLNVYGEMFAAWHTAGTPTLPDPFQPGKNVSPEKVESVPVQTLDQFCSDSQIKQIDFLKIDVEGAELDVLLGAGRMLAQGSIEAIMFEVSKPQVEGFGRNGTEVFDFLKKYDFHFFEIMPDGQLKPMKNLGTIQNIYQNFIAIKANPKHDYHSLLNMVC